MMKGNQLHLQFSTLLESFNYSCTQIKMEQAIQVPQLTYYILQVKSQLTRSSDFISNESSCKVAQLLVVDNDRSQTQKQNENRTDLLWCLLTFVERLNAWQRNSPKDQLDQKNTKSSKCSKLNTSSFQLIDGGLPRPDYRYMCYTLALPKSTLGVVKLESVALQLSVKSKNTIKCPISNLSCLFLTTCFST